MRLYTQTLKSHVSLAAERIHFAHVAVRQCSATHTNAQDEVRGCRFLRRLQLNGRHDGSAVYEFTEESKTIVIIGVCVCVWIWCYLNHW